MADPFTEQNHSTTLKLGRDFDAPWLVIRHSDPAEVVADLAKVSTAVAKNADKVTPLEAVALAAREAQDAWNRSASYKFDKERRDATKVGTPSPDAFAQKEGGLPEATPTFEQAVETVKDKLGGTELPDEPEPAEGGWDAPPPTKSSWGGATTTPARDDDDTPSCAHGKRVHRTGEKDGRKWSAWFCPKPRTAADNCGAIWGD